MNINNTLEKNNYTLNLAVIDKDQQIKKPINKTSQNDVVLTTIEMQQLTKLKNNLINNFMPLLLKLNTDAPSNNESLNLNAEKNISHEIANKFQRKMLALRENVPFYEVK